MVPLTHTGVRTRNKISVFSVEISLKYWLSVGLETILPTDSWLAKKSEKNRRNIGNSRYFGKISRLYLTRVFTGISEKISVNIRDISVNIGYLPY